MLARDTRSGPLARLVFERLLCLLPVVGSITRNQGTPSSKEGRASVSPPIYELLVAELCCSPREFLVPVLDLGLSCGSQRFN